MTYKQLITEIQLRAAYNPEVLDQDVALLELGEFFPVNKIRVADKDEDRVDPGQLFLMR